MLTVPVCNESKVERAPLPSAGIVGADDPLKAMGEASRHERERQGGLTVLGTVTPQDQPAGPAPKVGGR